MKVHDCEQGSAEWHALRLGRPTASEFHRIVTPTGKLSKQSRAYAMRLVAERLLNRPMESVEGVQWMEHGRATEPEAARAYEFQNDVRTQVAGFVTTDDGRTGCSPDRLVGDAGLLEIKCPSPAVHLGYLLDGFNDDYLPQVQGQLLVVEREWCDWFSYQSEMPGACVRSYRDKAYLARLAAALDEFNDLREALYEQALAAGVFAVQPQVLTPHEAALGSSPSYPAQAAGFVEEALF